MYLDIYESLDVQPLYLCTSDEPLGIPTELYMYLAARARGDSVICLGNLLFGYKA